MIRQTKKYAIALLLLVLLTTQAFGQTLKTNLISDWSFDEASGNILDGHGTNNLTDNGSIGAAAGLLNGARTFVGGQYANIANNAGVTVAAGQSFSMIVWVRPNSTGSSMAVCANCNSSGGTNFSLILSSADNRWRGYGGNGVTVSSVMADSYGAPQANTWVMLAFGYDAVTTKLKIRVNNGTTDEVVFADGLANTNGGLAFGQLGDFPVYYFDGKIDQARFRKRWLTDAELLQEWNGGVPLAYSALLAPATTYTFAGPTEGLLNYASANYTITPNGDDTGVVYTPHSTGTGTFTPSTKTATGGEPLTFTYTPTSGGTHTINITNSGALTNPATIAYAVDSFLPTSISPALYLQSDLGRFDATTAGSTPANTAGIKRWEDQSGNGMHFTEGSNPPTRDDSGINGRTGVRFTASSQKLSLASGSDAALTSVQDGSYSITFAVEWVTFNGGMLLSKGAGRHFYMERGIDPQWFERYNQLKACGCDDGIGQSGYLTLLRPYVITYQFNKTSGNTGVETIYIDGLKCCSQTITLSAPDTVAPWYICAGDVGSGVTFFADLRMYGICIYASQVNADRQAIEKYFRLYMRAPPFISGFVPNTRIVCVGDSRTYGVGSTSAWPYQMHPLLSSNVLIQNAGVSGAGIGLYSAQQYAAVDANTVGVVWLGANHIIFGADSGATMYGLLAGIVSSMKSSGYTKVFVCTEVDCSTYDAGMETRRADYNAAIIAGGANADGVIRLDQTPIYGSDPTAPLHFGDAASGAFAQVIATAISPTLVPANKGGAGALNLLDIIHHKPKRKLPKMFDKIPTTLSLAL